MPITISATFDQRVADALQVDRFNLLVIAVFAVVAVLIAAVGIYAALAYAMTERTREFGVRLALGARPERVVATALLQAIRSASPAAFAAWRPPRWFRASSGARFIWCRSNIQGCSTASGRGIR